MRLQSAVTPCARVACLAIFCLSLMAAGSAAQAQETVAQVEAVSGRAVLQRGLTSLTVEAGLDVQRLDEIMTSGDGRLRLAFLDGTVITVGPNSRVLVQYYLDALNVQDRRPRFLTLVVGILRASVPKISSLGWSVETRAAIASSRSTEWIVEASAETTSVLVLGGRVEVTDTQGGRLLLTGGEGVDVTLSQPMAAQPVRWNAVRVIDAVERTTLR
ncbi:FecR family protein [Algihabitans albus]|uniref:FecR family protein n=1 Tax=Algihabitans albus TaxID=2164067 RepID=UPI0013C312E6|nr:FecR family protein [Algihabitans albus]